MNQRMSGPKKAKANEQKNTISNGQAWRRSSLVMGVFYFSRKWKSWLYEGHHGFFEVLGHFGKNCDAFGAKTEDDDQRTFLQDNHPKVYFQICLCFVQGSVVEYSWVAC